MATAWFGWNRLHPADSGVGQVITGMVKRGDLIETVTATGSVAAQTGAEVKIGSQITGRIKRLYADVGTVGRQSG
jgi:multidrug efflux pump subunit AcrA (membrane-fusion protein)